MMAFGDGRARQQRHASETAASQPHCCPATRLAHSAARLLSVTSPSRRSTRLLSATSTTTARCQCTDAAVRDSARPMSGAGLSASGSDPASVSLSAAAVGADTAKRAQLQQMQVYIAGVQPLFESVLTDLLLHQPADPHQFLLDALGQVPPSARADLCDQLARQDQRGYGQEDKQFNRAKSQQQRRRSGGSGGAVQ